MSRPQPPIRREPARQGTAARVRSLLWDVVLPREPQAAVSVTLAVVLFGCLSVVVTGTADHPLLTFGLGFPIICALFFLIHAQPQRHAPRRKKPRAGP